MQPRVSLLTGATDGIGLALARRWQARGELVYLHGRRALDELEGLGLSSERYLQADLARSGAGLGLALEFLQRSPRLDRLVLNAGTGWAGAIAQQPADSLRSLLETNLLAPLELCHGLLEALLATRGRIVFISSVLSEIACPEFAAYAASKRALEGLARSLRSEFEGRLEIQVLRPGATRTGLLEKSGLDAASLGTQHWPSAERVAAQIDAALAGRPRWKTLGLGNQLARAAGRNLPGWVDRMRSSRR